MNMKFKAPRGTNDHLPVDEHIWNCVEKTARKTAHTFGFHQIDTPMFEQTELFRRGVGEGTDVVQKEMYNFKDLGNNELTLRPEGTASVCRAFIEHGMHNDQNAGVSGILYVNNCNGYTKFENGKKIKSEKNKYIEFDSTLKHSGSSCTDQQRRIVINFNYQ